jgi:hypothetical protein
MKVGSGIHGVAKSSTVNQREHVSWRCDAFELVDAPVLIGKTQPRRQFSRGARDEDLTRGAKRHDAGGLVNSEPSDPTGDHFHLTGVYSGSDV